MSIWGAHDCYQLCCTTALNLALETRQRWLRVPKGQEFDYSAHTHGSYVYAGVGKELVKGPIVSRLRYGAILLQGALAWI